MFYISFYYGNAFTLSLLSGLCLLHLLYLKSSDLSADFIFLLYPISAFSFCIIKKIELKLIIIMAMASF